MKRSPLSKISASKLKALGGFAWSTFKQRVTGIKKRNRERAAWKFERNFHSSEFVDFTRGQVCSCGCGRGPCEAAHGEPRGMEGCGADWTRVFPLFWQCHREFDAHKRPDIEARKEEFIAAHHEKWRRIQGEAA